MSDMGQSLSEKAALTGAFIAQRLQDNLDFFKDYIPDIYESFKNYQEKRYFLIYGQDGEINLYDRDDNKTLYGIDPINDLLESLSEYKEKPVIRPYFMGSGDPDFEYIIPVHHKMVSDVGRLQLDAFRKLLSARYLEELSGNINGGVESVSAGHLPNYVNSFFVFSVGLGFDLEKLYFDHDIRRLYVVENDRDSFYASLQLIDWKGMVQKALDNDYKIHFFISDNSDEVLEDLSVFINKNGRHNVAGSYLYSSFFQDGNEKIYQNFKDNLDLSIFSGFGFYDDSRMSVAHTVLNVMNDVPCIKYDKSIRKGFSQFKYPVFLIGSGPSLDSDISYIKDSRDSCVIISCGSSLKALYVNGIKPDIHVELERTAHVLHWIKNTSDDPDFARYLKDIHFIGMSQVHPGVFDLFGSVGQMPKDNETGSLLLHKALGEKGVPVIARTAPTCVHAGVTAAILLGFTDLYMFGVDMGYKSYDSHHSKHSLYSDLTEETSDKLVPSNASEVEVEANFEGETVFTSGFFPMFKRALEGVVSGWNYNFGGKLNIYNCSDGAKIDGAEPKRSKDIDLGVYDVEGLNREEMVEDLFKGYFAFNPESDDKERLKMVLEDTFDKVDLMSAWLKKRLHKVDNIPDALNIIDDLSYKFHSDLDSIGIDENDGWLYSVFDGSLLYLLSGIVSTLSLPIDESIRIEIFNEMIDCLDDGFDSIKNDFRENAFVADKEEYYDFFS